MDDGFPLFPPSQKSTPTRGTSNHRHRHRHRHMIILSSHMMSNRTVLIVSRSVTLSLIFFVPEYSCGGNCVPIKDTHKHNRNRPPDGRWRVGK